MIRTLARFVGTAVLAAAAAVAMAQTPVQEGAAPKRVTCADCGVVQSVRLVQQQGQGTGLGAVAGGVLGGVLGHQIGSGRGNTVATVAGAAGGAYAGHQIEKNKNAKSYWVVAIRMDGGQTLERTFSAQPTVREGERVKLIDGGRRLALLAP